MANLINSSYGSATAFTITLDSNGDGVGQQSTQVTDVAGPQVRVWATIVTVAGSDANTLVEFYIARTDGTIQAGSGGASNAVWANHKSEVQLVHCLVVDGDVGTFKCSFLIDDPGPSFHIIVFNETGDDLGTGCSMRYRSITPEVQ